MVKAVFFDRDGVFTKLIPRGDMSTAPWTLDEFELYDRSDEAVSQVKKLGFLAFCVTNQPDLNDELMSTTDFDMMNEVLMNTLDLDDMMAAFERGDAYYKPNTGMVDELVDEYKIDKTESYFVGDSWKDVVCGYRAGLKTIFIGDKYTCPEEFEGITPDYMVTDVYDAALLIEKLENDDETFC
jgi:D-glycero-D-manno-heptose 1,7-bisphosphate phosphatase